MPGGGTILVRQPVRLSVGFSEEDAMSRTG